MSYPLSICIPAYDRSQCLDELLHSIVVGNPGQAVQVCIGDDAAPPATEAVVLKWQARYPHIVYHRFTENRGIDRNVLKAVEIATGEYCWLMGDDDKVEPGAVSLVLNKIKEHGRPLVLNLNGSRYDRQLTTRLSPHVKEGVKKNALVDDTAFDNLAGIVATFGDSFGFLGDNVFRREPWAKLVSVVDLSPYIGSVYVHLAVLLMMLRETPNLVYVHERCVGFRGGNDCFLKSLGQVRRLRLDVEGYSCVARGVFPKGDRVGVGWLARIIAVHVRSRVWGIVKAADRAAIRQARSLTFHHFRHLPAFWFHVAPLVLLPRPVLFGVRGLYKIVTRSRSSLGSRLSECGATRRPPLPGTD